MVCLGCGEPSAGDVRAVSPGEPQRHTDRATAAPVDHRLDALEIWLASVDGWNPDQATADDIAYLASEAGAMRRVREFRDSGRAPDAWCVLTEALFSAGAGRPIEEVGAWIESPSDRLHEVFDALAMAADRGPECARTAGEMAVHEFLSADLDARQARECAEGLGWIASLPRDAPDRARERALRSLRSAAVTEHAAALAALLHFAEDGQVRAEVMPFVRSESPELRQFAHEILVGGVPWGDARAAAAEAVCARLPEERLDEFAQRIADDGSPWGERVTAMACDAARIERQPRACFMVLSGARIVPESGADALRAGLIDTRDDVWRCAVSAWERNPRLAVVDAAGLVRIAAESEDPGKRASVLRLAARVGLADLGLVRFIDDESPKVQSAAWFALGGLATEWSEWAARAEAAVRGGDVDLARGVLTFAARSRGRPVDLMTWMESAGVGPERVEAAMSAWIAWFGREVPAEIIRELAPRLSLRVEDERWVLRAIEAGGGHRASEWLRSPDANVRTAAMRAEWGTGTTDDGTRLGWLVRGLKDPAPAVVVAALHAVSKDDLRRDELRTVLDDLRSHPEDAVRSLALLGSGGAVDEAATRHAVAALMQQRGARATHIELMAAWGVRQPAVIAQVLQSVMPPACDGSEVVAVLELLDGAGRLSDEALVFIRRALEGWSHDEKDPRRRDVCVRSIELLGRSASDDDRAREVLEWLGFGDLRHARTALRHGGLCKTLSRGAIPSGR